MKTQIRVFFDIYKNYYILRGINAICTKHIPVIYFSSDDRIEKFAKEAGADAHLAKPFQIPNMIEIAQRFIGAD